MAGVGETDDQDDGFTGVAVLEALFNAIKTRDIDCIIHLCDHMYNHEKLILLDNNNLHGDCKLSDYYFIADLSELDDTYQFMLGIKSVLSIIIFSLSRTNPELSTKTCYYRPHTINKTACYCAQYDMTSNDFVYNDHRICGILNAAGKYNQLILLHLYIDMVYLFPLQHMQVIKETEKGIHKNLTILLPNDYGDFRKEFYDEIRKRTAVYKLDLYLSASPH